MPPIIDKAKPPYKPVEVRWIQPKAPTAPTVCTGTIYIGVDPGNTGGIAIIRGKTVQLFSLKDKSEAEVWDFFKTLREQSRLSTPLMAYLEKVGGMIKVKGEGVGVGPSMFKFGQSYGMLRMALTGSGIPFEDVTPQAWQKGMGIVPRKKGEKQHVWKGRLKQRASSLFPNEKVNLQVCDALLLAEFCKRKMGGGG